jgi:hypothetical protein
LGEAVGPHLVREPLVCSAKSLPKRCDPPRETYAVLGNRSATAIGPICWSPSVSVTLSDS